MGEGTQRVWGRLLWLDCGSSGTLQNLPGLHWEALSNLTGVDAVVHQKQFDVFFVSDEELLEARFELISGFLVLFAANLGFSDLASEASPHSGVNTSLLSPRSLKNTKTNATLATMINKDVHLKSPSPCLVIQRERPRLKKRLRKSTVDSLPWRAWTHQTGISWFCSFSSW